MKKTFCALLSAALLCLMLPGCEEKPPEKLRICFDVGGPYDVSGGKSQQEETAREVLDWLDSCLQDMDYGVSSEDVELELIPSGGELSTERETALRRVRTEILSGGGPDVFICSTTGDLRLLGGNFLPDGDRLFPYVDKAMEEDFFLPLDDYMERSVLTNWDDMFQTVMDGGRNSAGEQVVLPMTFLLPVTMFHRDEVPKIDYEGLAWDDARTGGPALNRLTEWPFWRDLDAKSPEQAGESKSAGSHMSGLAFLYPELADCRSGELAFSEEDLKIRVKESIAACQKAWKEQGDARSNSTLFHTLYSSSAHGLEINGFCWEDRDVSLLPLLNEAGGATAAVSLWCAVNANSKRPGDAFAVADALLCQSYQNKGALYDCNSAMPTNKKVNEGENIRFQGSPMDRPHSLTAQQYEEWARACEAVSAVRYPSAFDMELSLMMEDVQREMLRGVSGARPEDWEIYALPRFIQGGITDEALSEIVHAHYQKMERLLDES